MKNVHKFLNHVDLPWIHLLWELYYPSGSPFEQQGAPSFWWKDNLKHMLDYKKFAECYIQSGQTISFWNDTWSDTPLSHEWPQLFSFALHKDITVHDVINCNDRITLFATPLSTLAFDQFQLLNTRVNSLDASHQHDSWRLPGNLNAFSTALAYDLLIDHIDILLTFKWIWDSCCQLKHKVFIWLMIINRLNTRALL